MPPKEDRLTKLHVRADHCPQVLLHVLELIAQRGVIPATILAERRVRELRIEIELDGLPIHSVEVLLARIGAIVGVRAARLARKPVQG